jgi:hypothetical protein
LRAVWRSQGLEMVPFPPALPVGETYHSEAEILPGRKRLKKRRKKKLIKIDLSIQLF